MSRKCKCKICKKELDSFIDFISQKITIKSGTSINLGFLERYISIRNNLVEVIRCTRNKN